MQIPCGLSKCALQWEYCTWDWTESIEGATACRHTVHVWSLINVYGIYGRGQVTALGKFPYSFEKRVPHIGFVKVERLGLTSLPKTEGSSDRNKALLTYSAKIRSPVGNWTRATLVRDWCATNWPPDYPTCIYWQQSVTCWVLGFKYM